VWEGVQVFGRSGAAQPTFSRVKAQGLDTRVKGFHMTEFLDSFMVALAIHSVQAETYE
jgi:hypothetical protein